MKSDRFLFGDRVVEGVVPWAGDPALGVEVDRVEARSLRSRCLPEDGAVEPASAEVHTRAGGEVTAGGIRAERLIAGVHAHQVVAVVVVLGGQREAPAVVVAVAVSHLVEAPSTSIS